MATPKKWTHFISYKSQNRGKKKKTHNNNHDHNDLITQNMLWTLCTQVNIFGYFFFPILCINFFPSSPSNFFSHPLNKIAFFFFFIKTLYILKENEGKYQIDLHYFFSTSVFLSSWPSEITHMSLALFFFFKSLGCVPFF